GKVYKVVKYAVDVTEAKTLSANHEAQIEAINRSQAVIEFDLNGNILTANENFLGAVGYSLNEIRGQHHSMFVLPGVAQSREYSDFWFKLKQGEFQTGEFNRVTKGGKEIWIQASYNPIRGSNGQPTKIVKYAYDITATKNMQLGVEKLVAELSDVMNAMAEGDLTKKISGNYDEKFDDLTKNVNVTIDRLIQVARSIRGSA
ncbi:unnamed protein product, partial [Cyprideis torosa]